MRLALIRAAGAALHFGFRWLWTKPGICVS
jgi:hypothetical protein